ncbi:acyltransferase [Pannus brasiliensis CCIBt3594]|uniref:Acyltransferase n=1 Tax=Pannus brasiliensis CCIBt3594 TaxID=1427578 RepID=A0AAW9QG81_9CHRO
MPPDQKSLGARLDWLDRMKGLAILGIVAFHFFQNYPERIPPIVLVDEQGAKLGYAGVDIFFVIVGFTTSYMLAKKIDLERFETAKIDWKSWLIKRLERIYPSYILAVILTLSLYYFFLPIQRFDPIKFTLSFLGLAAYRFQDINPGFWFFTVLLEAYLLIPIVFEIAGRKKRNILLLGIAIGVLTKIVCLFFLAPDQKSIYLYFLQNNFVGSYFFQVVLGLYWGLIYYKKGFFRRVDYKYSIGLFGIGLTIYIALTLHHITPVYKLGFDMFFTPFLIILIHFLLIQADKIQKTKILSKSLFFLSLLGIYSYQIYLIHQPLYLVLLPNLTSFLTVNPYLKVFISFTIAMVLLTIYVIVFTRLEIIFKKFAFDPLLEKLRRRSNS